MGEESVSLRFFAGYEVVVSIRIGGLPVRIETVEDWDRVDAFVRDRIGSKGIPKDAPVVATKRRVSALSPVALALDALRESGEPMTTNDLVAVLSTMGWVYTTSNPGRSLDSRLYEHPDTFKRHKAKWFLKEWLSTSSDEGEQDGITNG